MSLNVVMELPIWEGNEHLFSCSVLAQAVLKLLERYGCPNTCAPNNDFCLSLIGDIINETPDVLPFSSFLSVD